MKFRRKAVLWTVLAALAAVSPAPRHGSSRAQAPQPTPPQQQERPRRAGDAPTPQPTVPPEQASPSPIVAPPLSPPVAPAQPPPSPTPAGQTVEDDDVVSVDASLVNVLFNAANRDRRFVTTLAREDVRVYENDQLQEPTIFQRETELPLSLAFLVDVSSSQETTLPSEQAAALAFIDSIMRPGRDQAAVVSFTGTATVEQDLTRDHRLLREAVARLKVVQPPPEEVARVYRAGEEAEVVPAAVESYGMPGSTALWDAVWATATELLAQSPPQARRAIILLSDGDDSGRPYGRMTREEAAEAVVRANAVVYSVGVEPYCPGQEYACRLDKKALRRLSEATGGRAFFPEDDTELRAAFHQIQEELRTQYLVAYSPANKARDGSWRRIRIEVVNPKLKGDKIKLTYREGYFAAPPRPAPPPRERAPQERLRRPPRRPRKG